MNIDESLTAKGFTPGSQVPDRTIEEIFIHHWGALGQTHDGVVDFFVNGPGATSAHFVASAGRVHCLVSPPDVAWHAGQWSSNIRSVGIECRPEATDEDYRQVAELVSWLRSQHGDLPLKPHKSVYNTACPGVWDLNRLDREARAVGTSTIAPQGNVTPVAAAPVPPTPTPTPPAEERGLSWIVEAGDTLGGIAAYYGIDVWTLVRHNNIADVNTIHVGQRIAIPGPLVWIVDPGDTLAGIAAHYGLSVDVVAANNGIADPDQISVGQTIRIL